MNRYYNEYYSPGVLLSLDEDVTDLHVCHSEAATHILYVASERGARVVYDIVNNGSVTVTYRLLNFSIIDNIISIGYDGGIVCFILSNGRLWYMNISDGGEVNYDFLFFIDRLGSNIWDDGVNYRFMVNEGGSWKELTCSYDGDIVDISTETYGDNSITAMVYVPKYYLMLKRENNIIKLNDTIIDTTFTYGIGRLAKYYITNFNGRLVFISSSSEGSFLSNKHYYHESSLVENESTFNIGFGNMRILDHHITTPYYCDSYDQWVLCSSCDKCLIILKKISLL